MPRNLLFCTFGSEKYFAGKRKMAETIFKAQPSFSPYFDFTLMNVVIYRDEVKLLLIQVYFFRLTDLYCDSLGKMSCNGEN